MIVKLTSEKHTVFSNSRSFDAKCLQQKRKDKYNVHKRSVFESKKWKSIFLFQEEQFLWNKKALQKISRQFQSIKLTLETPFFQIIHAEEFILVPKRTVFTEDWSKKNWRHNLKLKNDRKTYFRKAQTLLEQ